MKGHRVPLCSAAAPPWSRIQDEASDHHEAQLEALINEYEQNGDLSEVACIKAENALLPLYRKELRIVFLEYLKWMHAMKKDSTFRKVMQTRQDLKDSEGYDWLESTELAVDKRKFLLYVLEYLHLLKKLEPARKKIKLATVKRVFRYMKLLTFVL